MLVHGGPEILDENDCWRLIATAGVGRVGVTIGALPAILPVNYAVADGAILFRTGTGTKLRAAVNRSVVVFEVDDADPVYHGGWSVQAVGVAEGIAPGDHADAMGVAPWAPGARHTYVRIRPEMVSGRRITRAADD